MALKAALVSLMFLAGCAHAQPPELRKSTNHYAEEVSSTVWVEVNYHVKGVAVSSTGSINIDEDAGWSGSGVVVGVTDGVATILTAKHVVAKPSEFQATPMGLTKVEITDFKIIVENSAGLMCKVSGIKLADKGDLATMNTRCLIGPAAQIADTLPVVGAHVEAVGCPQAIHMPGIFPLMEGRFLGMINDRGHIQEALSTPVVGGASGSGVFNSRGEVVGIASEAADGFTHLAYAESLDNIKLLLAK